MSWELSNKGKMEHNQRIADHAQFKIDQQREQTRRDLSNAETGIVCQNAALDFDLACTLRLNAYDLERDEMQAKRIAYEALKGFAGSTDDGSDVDTSGAVVW